MARRGRLHTPHGVIETPVFMPVGTQATVKTLSPEEVRDIGAGIILSNTYHLHLRPGEETVRLAGGLHRFMNWPGAVLTDSGGFQVFSLSPLRRISEQGVEFRSHISGEKLFLSPEGAMQIQHSLGADIIMAFDECASYPSTEEYARKAMLRTHRWAERCAAAHTRTDQAIFGIVQGGTYPDLRKESAQYLASLNLPGYGIGGLSVGEPKETMYSVLEETTRHLPASRPRYLMGVGSPEDLFECVARGADMFDCVLPTRIARNGALFTRSGRLNIRNAAFQDDARPIEDGCGCYACSHFSRAYLRHLVKSEEVLGLRLATIHNLHFLLRLAEEIRAAIVDGTFPAVKQAFMAGFTPVDERVRTANRAARAASFQARRGLPA